MAPFRQSRSRVPTSHVSVSLRTPAPDDGRIGTWERRELEAMNKRFSEAMARSAFMEASEMVDPRFRRRNS